MFRLQIMLQAVCSNFEFQFSKDGWFKLPFRAVPSRHPASKLRSYGCFQVVWHSAFDNNNATYCDKSGGEGDKTLLHLFIALTVIAVIVVLIMIVFLLILLRKTLNRKAKAAKKPAGIATLQKGG